MAENRSLPSTTFLADPERIETYLHDRKSEEPIIVNMKGGDGGFENVLSIHMTPECALRIIAELQRATMGAGVCADCGIYKPLSGDIHCIDCDKKLERAHEEEQDSQVHNPFPPQSVVKPSLEARGWTRQDEGKER